MVVASISFQIKYHRHTHEELAVQKKEPTSKYADCKYYL